MTLELIPSRLAAMRNEYSLSVRNALYAEIPQLIIPYYSSAYRIELRTLYRQSDAIRYQWIFRDGRGMSRLTAAGIGSRFAARNRSPLSPEDAEKERNSGIVEIRNSDGDVTREFQFGEDFSEWDFRYSYRDSILVRTEIWFKRPPAPAAHESEEENNGEDSREAPLPAEPVFTLMFTDLYRYTRSGSLRAIDRRLHEGAFDILRVGFPRLGPGASLGDELTGIGGALTAEYFVGVPVDDDVTISYNLDNRGRILGESWKGEDGEILGELINTWSGDRLQSILWKSADAERLIEYEYDDGGNRIVEREFRNGELERSVTMQDGKEIEEVYIRTEAGLQLMYKK